MATINVKKYLTEEKLRAIFMQFDADNSGKITPSDIVSAMHKMGEDVEESDIKEMMEKHRFT